MLIFSAFAVCRGSGSGSDATFYAIRLHLHIALVVVVFIAVVVIVVVAVSFVFVGFTAVEYNLRRFFQRCSHRPRNLHNNSTPMKC